jgi:hypothetical protein
MLFCACLSFAIEGLKGINRIENNQQSAPHDSHASYQIKCGREIKML